MTIRQRIHSFLLMNGPSTTEEVSEVVRHPVHLVRMHLVHMVRASMANRDGEKWTAGEVLPFAVGKKGPDIAYAKRDHSARLRDMDRERLESDVAEYLARGGSIEVVPGYRDAPPVTRVRAYEGGWS